MAFRKVYCNISACGIPVSQCLEIVSVQDVYMLFQLVAVILPVLYSVAAVDPAACKDLFPHPCGSFLFAEFREHQTRPCFCRDRTDAPRDLAAHHFSAIVLECLTAAYLSPFDAVRVDTFKALRILSIYSQERASLVYQAVGAVYDP